MPSAPKTAYPTRFPAAVERLYPNGGPLEVPQSLAGLTRAQGGVKVSRAHGDSQGATHAEVRVGTRKQPVRVTWRFEDVHAEPVSVQFAALGAGDTTRFQTVALPVEDVRTLADLKDDHLGRPRYLLTRDEDEASAGQRREALRARIPGPLDVTTEQARDAFIRSVEAKFRIMGMTPAQQDEFVSLLNDNNARVRVHGA